MNANNQRKKNNRGRSRRNVSTTKKGETALQAVYRFSKDQIVRSVKKRYLGRGGVANVAKDVGFLMSAINTEDKHVDLVQGFATVDVGTQQIIAIGTMGQGTTVSTRVGDSVLINRIDLQLQFSYSTGAPSTTNRSNQVFRYWLLRYLKTPSTNGTVAFAIGDFINQDSNTQYTTQSLPNADLNEDFQIMDTGEVMIQLPYAPTVTSTESVPLLIRKECHFHQTYSGAANTTITDNMVWLVVVAMNATNTGGASGFYLSQRTWFLDN